MKTSEIILCITFLWTAALQLQRLDAESADATNCMPLLLLLITGQAEN